MEARVDGWLLWPRALVVATVAGTLGVVGHVTADGRLPGAPVLLALWAGSVLLTGPMLTQPASPTRLVALVVGWQAAIHLGLSVTAGHTTDASPPAADPAAGGAPAVGTHEAVLPQLDGRRLGSLQDAYGQSGGLGDAGPVLPVGHLVDDLSAHAPMMAAHLLAAALVGLWLARGERLLWSVLALTGRRLLTLVTPTPAPPRPPLRPTASVGSAAPGLARLLRQLRHARPCSRRGPPLLAN